jgi:dihydroflavonol-4-reductase
MTRVLVTGANGHVGSNLVRVLLRRGYEVVPFVRRTSDLRGLEGLGLDYVVGDVMDWNSLRAAAEGCDVMIHLAAFYRYWAKDPDEILQPALIGTRNALIAAKEAGIERVIYTSTTWAVGWSRHPNRLRTAADWNEDAHNPYAIAKTQGEKDAWRLADELGLALITICPSGIIGPYDYRITPSMAVLQGLINGTTPVTKSGLSLVHVHDVAEVHGRAIDQGKPGTRYIVAGPNALMHEYGQVVAKLTGVTPLQLKGGRTILQVVAVLAELGSQFTNAEPLLTRALAQEMGDRYMFYDSSTTYETFGISPRSIEEIFRDGIRWLLYINALKPGVAGRLVERFLPDPAWSSSQQAVA